MGAKTLLLQFFCQIWTFWNLSQSLSLNTSDIWRYILNINIYSSSYVLIKIYVRWKGTPISVEKIEHRPRTFCCKWSCCTAHSRWYLAIWREHSRFRWNRYHYPVCTEFPQTLGTIYQQCRTMVACYLEFNESIFTFTWLHSYETAEILHIVVGRGDVFVLE